MFLQNCENEIREYFFHIYDTLTLERFVQAISDVEKSRNITFREKAFLLDKAKEYADYHSKIGETIEQYCTITKPPQL